jgi:WhiB family redox-sensing transcriptional regulator
VPQSTLQQAKLTAVTEFWDWQLHERCRAVGSATFSARRDQESPGRI